MLYIILRSTYGTRGSDAITRNSVPARISFVSFVVLSVSFHLACDDPRLVLVLVVVLVLEDEEEHEDAYDWLRLRGAAFFVAFGANFVWCQAANYGKNLFYQSLAKLRGL